MNVCHQVCVSLGPNALPEFLPVHFRVQDNVY